MTVRKGVTMSRLLRLLNGVTCHHLTRVRSSTRNSVTTYPGGYRRCFLPPPIATRQRTMHVLRRHLFSFRTHCSQKRLASLVSEHDLPPPILSQNSLLHQMESREYCHHLLTFKDCPLVILPPPIHCYLDTGEGKLSPTSFQLSPPIFFQTNCYLNGNHKANDNCHHPFSIQNPLLVATRRRHAEGLSPPIRIQNQLQHGALPPDDQRGLLSPPISEPIATGSSEAKYR